jgi:hypothetical protein
MKLPLRKPAQTSGRRPRLRGDAAPQPAASFSYHARRSDHELNTGRQVQREPVPRQGRWPRGTFWLSRFGAVVLLLAMVISMLNILSLSGDAKVVPLSKDSHLFLHGQADYSRAANGLLTESLLNRNKITLDSGKVSREMLRQFPELSSVSVTIPLLAHRPIIYIEASTPALVLAASNGSYILSSTGKALLPSGQLPTLSELNLPLVGDQSGVPVVVNQQALTSANVSFVQMVKTQLAAKGMATAAMTLPAAAGELDVQLAGQPYFVKFNLQSNTPREQVGTFLATVTALRKQNVTPAKYVDVRVEGRAYYQ